MSKDHQDVLTRLKKTKSVITPRKEFKDQLETLLVAQAKEIKVPKPRFPFAPIFSGIAAIILFTVLSISLLAKPIDEERTTVGEPSVIATKNEKQPVIFVQNVHNIESFLPELNKGKSPMDAYDEDINTSLVGARLTTTLNNLGIPALHDQTDYAASLKKQNQSFSGSYSLSRKQLKKVLSEYDSIQMIFDIHRDSKLYEETTTTINGKKMAKIAFFLNSDHKNAYKNEEFAKEIDRKLKQEYPTLSRGIFKKTNGVYSKNTLPTNKYYNQDLLPQSVLVEIGGIENSLEEVNRSTDILAEVIAEIVKDQKK